MGSESLIIIFIYIMVYAPGEVKPSCGPGKFRCNDGACIDEDYRCDEVADCRDGSDERFCGGVTEGSGMYEGVFMLTEGYENFVSDSKSFLFQVDWKDFNCGYNEFYQKLVEFSYHYHLRFYLIALIFWS